MINYTKYIKEVTQLFSIPSTEPVSRILRESLDCTECPEGVGFRVEIPRAIWDDIKILRNLYLPNECAMFLILEKRIDRFVVTDYYVPKQTTTRSTVEIQEIAPNSEYIAHLHSHGLMSAFYSGTDRAHFNYDVHIVIGSPDKKGFMIEDVSTVCVVRIKTSCNRIIQRDAYISIVEPPTPEPQTVDTPISEVPESKTPVNTVNTEESNVSEQPTS